MFNSSFTTQDIREEAAAKGVAITDSEASGFLQIYGSRMEVRISEFRQKLIGDYLKIADFRRRVEKNNDKV